MAEPLTRAAAFALVEAELRQVRNMQVSDGDYDCGATVIWSPDAGEDIQCGSLMVALDWFLEMQPGRRLPGGQGDG